MPGFHVYHQLPETAQTHVYRVSDAIQPSHPLMSPSSAFFNLPRSKVFSSESVLHIRWPKYGSFSFSISLSNEYSGLISFRIDWLDLLAAQGILKSLPQQFKSINSLVLSLLYGPTLISIHAAAAAKSLQLCPTLCDPIDRSPPGSPVPGILQARTLEQVAISFSNA